MSTLLTVDLVRLIISPLTVIPILILGLCGLTEFLKFLAKSEVDIPKKSKIKIHM